MSVTALLQSLCNRGLHYPKRQEIDDWFLNHTIYAPHDLAPRVLNLGHVEPAHLCLLLHTCFVTPCSKKCMQHVLTEFENTVRQNFVCKTYDLLETRLKVVPHDSCADDCVSISKYASSSH